MEQSPKYVGVDIRQFAGKWNARWLHIGSRRQIFASSQSRIIRVQSVFRGE